MSLPIIADVLVNCVPVSCIPSPESPAKRIVTVSSSSRCLSIVSTGGSRTALINEPHGVPDGCFWRQSLDVALHPLLNRRLEIHVFARNFGQQIALGEYPGYAAIVSNDYASTLVLLHRFDRLVERRMPRDGH